MKEEETALSGNHRSVGTRDFQRPIPLTNYSLTRLKKNWHLM
jgi:hypothetical protein